MSEYNKYVNAVNLGVISAYYHNDNNLPISRIAHSFVITSKEAAKIIAVSMATIEGDCIVIPSLMNITKAIKL